MKILMLCYEFPPIGGGGSAVVYGLSTELARRGHRVDLVTMAFRGEARREEVAGVHLHRVPCIRARRHYCTIPEAATYVLSAIPVASDLALRNRYDLLHSHFIFPDGLIALLIKKGTQLPMLITAHGSDVPGYNPHRLKVSHRLLKQLWRLVVGKASAVTCPSKTLESLIRLQGIPTPLHVIPNGTAVEHYCTDRPRARRILVVTRLLERKGVQYLIEALLEFQTDYELHIVGDGPYLPALVQVAKPLGSRVIFHGWMERDSAQLRELYETSGIFMLPSEAENFPVVLLEAMAAGLAIITTKETGCAEVVGGAALLVEPRSPQAIVSALTALTCDEGLRKRLGRAARARVEANYTWAVVADRYIEQYERLLRGGRGPHGGSKVLSRQRSASNSVQRD